MIESVFRICIRSVFEARSRSCPTHAGSHVETRALALLRKLQAVHEKAIVERPKPSRLSGRKRGAAASFNEDVSDRCCPLFSIPVPSVI